MLSYFILKADKKEFVGVIFCFGCVIFSLITMNNIDFTGSCGSITASLGYLSPLKIVVYFFQSNLHNSLA